MPEIMTKKEIRDRIRAERASFEQVLSQIPRSHSITPGVENGGWSKTFSPISPVGSGV